MPYAPTPKDRRLLQALVEYRQLTTSQIAALGSIGAPAARKRLRALRKAGLIQHGARPLSGRTGRPEELITISRGGIAWMRNAEGLSVSDGRRLEQPVRCTAHQHLLNWFRIHLVLAERSIQDIAGEFTAPDSTDQWRDPNDGSFGCESVRRSEDGGRVEFAPDGVFYLRHSAMRSALLFFLEVDMGTESVVGRSRNRCAFIAKIRNYQALFRTRSYKRYESEWNQSFNGFRLLVLTSTPQRRQALGRLVAQSPPSDFIWLTDSEQLFTEGVCAVIWSRGGSDKKAESILGKTLATRARIPILGARTGPDERVP